MAKRKSKRTVEGKAEKRNRRETGLYSLPEPLVHEILQWIRPTEGDQQAIWHWVCRMAATCVVFRRVMQSVTPGVAPLTPTLLELVPVSPVHTDGLWVHAGVVKLLKTIKRSNWMGSRIKSFYVEDYEYISRSDGNAAAAALRSLLTTSGRLPNLTDLQLKCPPYKVQILVDNKLFLPKLGRMHPELATLILTEGVLGLNRRDYIDPRAFASLAASLPNLQRFGCSNVIWLQSHHLVAFFSNVGSKLTSFFIKGSFGGAFNAEVFESVAANCHNLVELHARYGPIPAHEFGNILHSNKNLSILDVIFSECDDARVFYDSIVEHKPRLKEFHGTCCNWVDNAGIMRLLKSQINAFGRILLTKLAVKGTRVTPSGLRSALTLWREQANRVLPFEVQAWFTDGENGISRRELIDGLVDDFPEVDWHFGCPYRMRD